MSTGTLDPKPAQKRKRGRLIWPMAAAGVTLMLLPVILLGGLSNRGCGTAGPTSLTTPPAGPPAGGMFARPLELNTGQWYEVGATEYGGPSDPNSSNYGAINVPGQSYLPAHPDTFAELSVLDSNPANGGSFTFADANALDNLPYLTAVVVSNNGTKKILYKRDVGYGQGPGQLTANGQPYRLDVWWQSAAALGVSKSAVKIALAPPLGAGGLLGETPAPTTAPAGPNPLCDQLAATGMLQLVPGEQARILADGTAAAPQDAPAAVKLAIAAANQIDGTYYLAARPEPLNATYPWYDCSAATDYVLYHAGLNRPGVTVDGTDAGNSTLLESYGQSGPGKWISIYANSAHAFIVIAGLAFDTADFGGPNIPAGSGPRWRENPLGNLQDGLSYVVRHPVGL